MKFQITGLYIYPIKSLGGISLTSAKLTDIGFEHDRYWMLVNEQGLLFTQRDAPEMALFNVKILAEGVLVTYQNDQLTIPFAKKTADENIAVQIWGETILATKESDAINEWFSKKLKQKVYLVRPASVAQRLTKNHADAKVNFPDSNQFLVLGEAALANLNKKLEEEISIDRFRPNIVFSGGTPHQEDDWTAIQIGNFNFEATKACARCQVTTINQQTGKMGREPLKTLASYRIIDRKILFGQYFKRGELGVGSIGLGDEILIK